MRNVIMYAYSMGSASAKLLKRELGIRMIRHVGSRFRGGPRWTVINWGAGYLMDQPWFNNTNNLINKPGNVRRAANKLSCFQILSQARVPIPEYTTSPLIARGWLRTADVCLRYTLTGNSGEGLEIVSTGQERAFDAKRVAPLYTKFIPSDSEWRVHVFDGRAIHIQKKLRRRGAEGERRIRNTANGWVFSSNYDAPRCVREEGIRAVGALSLDFGAVDVVLAGNTAYVLEVNTAPGIEGASLVKYVQAFRGKLGR